MNISLFIKRYIVCLFTLLVFLNLNAIQQKYLHFTEIDGLPRNITTCLQQDSYGYLWIGTSNGIARYDGNSFISYYELSGTGVIDILIDSLNTIWVSTDNGLFKYNRITNFFERVVEGYISRIQEDKTGIFYLLTSNIYKVDSNRTELFYEGSNLTDFCVSYEGIWFGKNSDGIRLLSRKSGFTEISQSYLEDKFVSYINKIDDKLLVGCYNGEIFAVSHDGTTKQVNIKNHYFIQDIEKVNDEIWLATDGNGIIILDDKLNYSRTLSRSNNTLVSINSNSIYDIFQGEGGEIWLASYGAGLTCILPDNLLFTNIVPEKGNPNSLVANEGTSVCIKMPYFFFGTNYGLSTWNSKTNQFRNLPSSKLRNDLKGTKITAILADKSNNLWVGTYDGLLGKYNMNYNLISTFHPSGISAEEMQQIVYLHELDNNHLLILTQFQDKILLDMDINTGKIVPFELYSKGSNLTYCLLNSVRENQDGELIALVSDQGLFHVNLHDKVLENRLLVMNEQIDCYISDFYHDGENNYWCTSTTDGLISVSEDGSRYKKWTVKDGLPSNTLVRLESVDDRYLWISTISGICRFDMVNEQIQNFNHSDGLPANEFQDRSSGKTIDGKVIFGSLAGFTIIDPSKVTPDTLTEQVIISDISFQNQSIRNQKGIQFIKEPLEETKEIWLPYQKNSFTIHFFTKSQSYIKNHNYKYQLIGLENQPNYTADVNYATYTNLSPGTYTFIATSTDKSMEGMPTRLIIHIRAPWYFSWYAIIAYFIIFLVMIYLSAYAYLNRMQLKKEKEISEYKVQKEHELTEKKLAFFTSISHDLKTPLTLIDGPVNDLLQSDNLTDEQINKLQTVNRNSKRLYKLISDLIDFRKVTQKQYALKVRETRIADIIFDVCKAFDEESKNKSVNILTSVKEDLVAIADAEKIEKILWNLLSNAIKFSKKSGEINIDVVEIYDEGSKFMKLQVKDQGIGISDENKHRIFERFFKVQNKNMEKQEGTGIGLSIVKELVDLHHGTITVESITGAGTIFSIVIPSELESYDENEIDIINYEDRENVTFERGETIEKNEPSNPDKKHYNLPGILIVEDNVELRKYLAVHFKKKYKVFEAGDGNSGLELAIENNPDIILTDVQMPNMNGYEFCKKIRGRFDTSHIPVIMLTANNTVNQQIEGLSVGADVYITKPFEIKLLDAHIKYLLENRGALRKKFKGVETPENLEKSLSQKDIDFILELKLFIEENIMLQDLNIKLLSEHFAVSTAQLHRKTKALTGSTPNNLIKSIRLKRAYKLIVEDGLRVSEAAYQTGFSDPNYFTICFKKEFGKNPSQIA